MTKHGLPAFPATHTRPARFPVRFNWGLLILSVLLAAGPAPAQVAQDAEDQYLHIFKIIDQADTMRNSGQNDPARAKYQDAQAGLIKLRRDHPTWNTKAVAYRLNYVSEKIAALTPKATPGDSGKAAVKLLEAGAEPRKALRIQAKAGDKQTAVIIADISSGAGISATHIDMDKSPSVKMTLTVLPKNVSPQGDIDYELLIEDVTIGEESGAAKDAQGRLAGLLAMKGLQIECTITDRGFNKKSEVKIPAGTDAATRASMEEMKSSFATTEYGFPEEPVGPGGRWEVREKVKAEGITVDQTTTHELVSIDGDILTIRTTSVESAANQKVTNPKVPQMKVDLVKMSGSETSTITATVGKIFPAQGLAEKQTEATMNLDMNGRKQTMFMKSSSKTQIESK